MGAEEGENSVVGVLVEGAGDGAVGTGLGTLDGTAVVGTEVGTEVGIAEIVGAALGARTMIPLSTQKSSRLAGTANVDDSDDVNTIVPVPVMLKL